MREKGEGCEGNQLPKEISKVWAFHEFACVARAVPRSEMLTEPGACVAMEKECLKLRMCPWPATDPRSWDAEGNREEIVSTN